MRWEIESPCLRPEDGMDWENGGLYKPCLLEHQVTYYLFYNAKMKLLAREIRLARRLDGDSLVLHAGAHSIGNDAHQGLFRFAEGVAQAISEAGPGPRIVLENVPGGGRRMGGTLEELAELADLLQRRSIPAGYCLDTAHAWAQGYDIASSEGMWKFLGAVNRILEADRVAAFHLNDTRALLGSHRENHWNWGEGHLGADGLRSLLEREEYRDTPGILETPFGEDTRNLDFARRLKAD